jgi:hypothetical protein
LYQNRRRVFSLAGSRKEQVLGMIFSNLGPIETKPALVHGADECNFMALELRAFVSGSERMDERSGNFSGR